MNPLKEYQKCLRNQMLKMFRLKHQPYKNINYTQSLRDILAFKKRSKKFLKLVGKDNGDVFGMVYLLNHLGKIQLRLKIRCNSKYS